MNSKRVHDAIGKDKVDRMLLGHPEDYSGPRLSIMPLLSIGHPHSDARVRRVVLAEPFDGNGEVCHQLAEILNHKDLLPEGADKPVARLRRLSRSDHYIRRWYAGCAYQWASVSPVLLPGFDHPRSNSGIKALGRAEKLLRKALHHADISMPCRIEISPVSWWAGVPHARSFVPRDKLGPAPRYHVKLTFDQPFTGPLSLGRQRHTGLGVFAAMQDP
jgi:CRISPR-associated protein Csb2